MDGMFDAFRRQARTKGLLGLKCIKMLLLPRTLKGQGMRTAEASEDLFMKKGILLLEYKLELRESNY